MDADAIGGSVNLVTKTPEGAPRGYVAIAGRSRLGCCTRTRDSGAPMYGGRFGEDADVWRARSAAPTTGTIARSKTSSWRGASTATRRPRANGISATTSTVGTRRAAWARLDYRFDNGGTLVLRGLCSDSTTSARAIASTPRRRRLVGLASGATGIATGATFVREVSQPHAGRADVGASLQRQTPASVA